MRNEGVHAAGVVIAPGPVHEFVPVCTQASKGSGGESGDEKITVAQLPMKLQTYKVTAKDPRCVINSDGSASFKHVVAVLDEVRKSGIAKVGINTDKK